jgi:hypothetical protein
MLSAPKLRQNPSRWIRLTAGFCILCITAGAACDAELTTPPLSQLLITPPNTITVQPGQSVQLGTSITDETGRIVTDVSITWSVSNDLVASITQTGLLTARGFGSTTVRAEAKRGVSTVVGSRTVNVVALAALRFRTRELHFAVLEQTEVALGTPPPNREH